uniref:DNA-directed RNA polymerase n=1 Tax=Hildenbrandia rivularis TaxID=135206 RepID=A0A1C9CFF9_9FLOR|nr:RNA polymerase beta'' subunit [Hildenbrandia rivularis]AOM67099.1 RNA polymerase beta'' subunit [Hildenbrandia rivularis]
MQNTIISSQFCFANKAIDKKQLTALIVWAFSTYGIARAANMADHLKDLGFYYATKAGLSLSIEDLHIPAAKKILLDNTLSSIYNTDQQYLRGEITVVERFQKVIDTWHNTSEALKTEILKYFQEVDPLNSIYMMSLSGARGNMSQVRQLVGMRGLMSDPNGQIIDLPIMSNFREGLTVTEYFISSYGARKGLVDTALRTADSGYLTRRLVDVSQHVIVRQADCHTKKGIILEDMVDNQKILISLEQSLLGRVLAENVYHPNTGSLIANTNQCLALQQVKNIVDARINKVLVRSPLTCESSSGVCQLCYGWNLAHRKLVDIGEAVGIIAAQSIGEPGTQLTMRTFHTGGVFTGEVAQKIYSPIKGVIKHPQKTKLVHIRTKHGDVAFYIEHDCTIFVESQKRKKVRLNLSQGTALLVGHNVQVEEGQTIAEFPLSNYFTIEEAEKQVITDLSGKVLFTDLTIQETNDNQFIVRSTKKAGLVWILSGQVYDIPDSSKILVKPYDKIKKYTPLAQQTITNQFSGYVRIPNINSNDSKFSTDIQIVVAEYLLQGVKVYLDNKKFQGSYILETTKKDKFVLQVSPGEKILNGHIMANLVSNTYKTITGGIVKYLDLPVAHRKSKFLRNSYEVLGTGYVLWISEETHEVNKDASLLFVEHGDMIEAGTEIIKNTFARISGVVEIVKKDDAVREVIIKPGKLYISSLQALSSAYVKHRGFLRPGDQINNEIYTDKLVYWEYLQKLDNIYILIRPVTVYAVPRKHYSFESEYKNHDLQVRVIRTTKFRDGERVKSVSGIDIIKSHLVVFVKKDSSNLYTTLECISCHRSKKLSQLKLVTLENLVVKNNNSNVFGQSTNILVKNNQEIPKNTVVAKIETLANLSGEVENICETKNARRRVLVSSDVDQCKVIVQKPDRILVKLYQWIYAGENISHNVLSQYSGQVTEITNNKVILRVARPYLLSKGADLYVDNNDLVRQGESIATIKFQRPKTKDIVQGLPKVEEILEARKKSATVFKPHIVLAESFKQYLQVGLSLLNATRLSLQKIQLHLVKEIQLVYQSQKVDISDKHIEVIVKQMTSKVEVETGGHTNYLPAEMVDLDKIEALNKFMYQTNQKTAVYVPIVLGITKASLNTGSFISAASFQETTKVLTEAAISGKLDWLKGLKENVIIGRLIPAGTGFNVYNNIEKQIILEKDHHNANTSITNHAVTRNVDDIILDDRTISYYKMIN